MTGPKCRSSGGRQGAKEAEAKPWKEARPFLACFAKAPVLGHSPQNSGHPQVDQRLGWLNTPLRSSKCGFAMAFRLQTLLPLICLVLLTAAPARSEAQTILLPTRTVTNVNTVVSVPDGGWNRLGGISRYSAGRITRGIPGLPANPFTNSRGIGAESGANQYFVHVQILDMSELEAQHMAGFTPAPAIRSTTLTVEPSAAVRRRAEFLTRNLGSKGSSNRR